MLPILLAIACDLDATKPDTDADDPTEGGGESAGDASAPDTSGETGADSADDTAPADTAPADTAAPVDTGTPPPAYALQIVLTWDTDGADLDLHLAAASDAWFQVPEDCSFCNEQPDWGTTGEPLDDPQLAVDDVTGYGPESIVIEDPAAGVYHVGVHHYQDLWGTTSPTATLQVLVDGWVVSETSAPLLQGELWEVATVTWPSGTVDSSGSVVGEEPARDCE